MKMKRPIWFKSILIGIKFDLGYPSNDGSAFYLAFISSDFLCDLVVNILATDPEARVRFQTLPDFLRSSGSGTGSTQPREYN
jgi:hypothetical protein